MKKVEEDDPDMPWFIRSRIFSPAITARIDYVDYVVARTFLEGIEEWVCGCKKNSLCKPLKILKKSSDFISELFGIAIAIAIFVVAYINSNKIVSQPVISQESVKFCLIFAASLFIFCPVAARFGQAVEKLIYKYQPISYLKLNKGDEHLIDEYEKSQKMTLLYVILNTSATIFLGIISSKIAASW